MEMNTRIQVEHGVTELVTGIDLVEEQLRVASGLPLSFTQEDVSVRGHAIECRINAEIPEQNFMPSPGTVTKLHLPGGNGVRVDTALYTGYMVPSTYDSMIAKLLVHGPTREAAIARLRAALDETVIAGIDTNLSFQYRLTDTDAFRSGKTDTGFVEHFVSGQPR
jgi:acetyl-CoA carboxylase biotin carboxylase subunit